MASLVLTVFAGCLVGATGCKKAESPPPPTTTQMAGVTLEVPKLDTEFQNSSPEVQTAVSQIKVAYRGGRFAKMLTELDALGNDPSLTESQKKLVGNLIEQIKQLMVKIPSPPG